MAEVKKFSMTLRLEYIALLIFFIYIKQPVNHLHVSAKPQAF